MSQINVGIGKKLRERRTNMGLTQEALGKGVGLSSQQVHKYEKGTNSMTAPHIQEFARFLKVAPTYFFEGIDTQASKKTNFSTTAAPEEDTKSASDRELIEAMKAFNKIKDKMLRRRVAELLRSLSQKESQ